MKLWIAQCMLAATLGLSSIDANASTYTGALLFQGVEKYVKGVADHAKDFDAATAMTMGYIIGVVDADRRICADRASVAQLMVIVDSYLKLHPDMMDKNAAESVSMALREAFSCGKGKR